MDNTFPKPSKIKKVTRTGAVTLDNKVGGQNVRITEVANNRWEIVLVNVKVEDISEDGRKV